MMQLAAFGEGEAAPGFGQNSVRTDAWSLFGIPKTAPPGGGPADAHLDFAIESFLLHAVFA